MSGKKIYLLLGGNVGDRLHWLQTGREGIAENIGTIIRASSVYETAAWGNEAQNAFLNQVIAVSTMLSPLEVLGHITFIEQDLAGRIRTEKWAPRTLDIDILFYENDIVDIPGLHIPHPHFQERRFALMPMAEIAPSLQHPVLKKTVARLLNDCTDPLDVTLYRHSTVQEL